VAHAALRLCIIAWSGPVCFPNSLLFGTALRGLSVFWVAAYIPARIVGIPHIACITDIARIGRIAHIAHIARAVHIVHIVHIALTARIVRIARIANISHAAGIVRIAFLFLNAIGCAHRGRRVQYCIE